MSNDSYVKLAHGTRNLRLDIDADGIATILFDRVGRSMNTLNAEVGAELEALVEHIRIAPDIHGVVIASGKDNAFCAGADLDEFAATTGAGMTGAEFDAALPASARLSRTFRALETMGKPVVAAIEGLALGGGLELALAAHTRVISPGVRLGLPEVTIGLLPGAGGTQRTPRLAGVGMALDLMLTGRQIASDEALANGLADRLVPLGQTIAAAKHLLRVEASAAQPWDTHQTSRAQPTNAADVLEEHSADMKNYPAKHFIARCVLEGSALPFDAGLALEERLFLTVQQTQQARAMIRTLFVSKQALAKGARLGVSNQPDAYMARILDTLRDEVREMKKSGVPADEVARAIVSIGLPRELASQDDASGHSHAPAVDPMWPPFESRIEQRLISRSAIEAVRCLEEGLVPGPREADVGAVFGAGSPAWSGGPISFIDSVGIAKFVADCDGLTKEEGRRFDPPALLREMAASGTAFYPAPVRQ